MPRLPARLRPLWPVAKAVHTRATAAVSPLTRRLAPGLPSGVALTAQAAGAVHPAFPAERFRRPLPEGVPAGHWRFAATADKQVPAAGTLELPGGRVLAPYAAVITGDDRLAWSVSTYFGTDRPSRHPVWWQVRTPPVEHLAGRVAALTSRGDGNYFHFLLDVLPRLAVLEASGVTADRYLVPCAAGFQRELLAAAGVPADRVLDSTRHPHVRADVLVVPDLPARDLQTPSWLVPWLRRTLLREPGPRARLYVTRGREPHTRRVINEEQVQALLGSHGFVPVDLAAMPVAEQVAAFAGAEAVVAPHGAGLANLAFASPGCEVVELFAADYVNTCYWELSTQVPGLRYRYLVAGGTGGRRERAMAGVSSDVTVDVRALERLLPA